MGRTGLTLKNAEFCYENRGKQILYKSWRPKGFNQFEIIINVLFSSFRFI